MRPRLILALAIWLGDRTANWLVPDVPFLYALAMAATLFVFVRRLRRESVIPYHSLGAGIWTIVGAFLGSRLLDSIENLNVTLADPWQLLSFNAGLSSWGSYVGGSLALVAYCRRNHQGLARNADAVGTCLGLGIFFCRCACFVNGDDFGTLSNLPWAVRFPHASYPFIAQVQAGLINATSDLSLPVHPVQLYLALIGLLLFVTVRWLWKRLRPWPGATFCSFWLMYCPVRFFVEFLRGDETRPVQNVLTAPQVFAALAFVAAAIGFYSLTNSHPATLASEGQKAACPSVSDVFDGGLK